MAKTIVPYICELCKPLVRQLPFGHGIAMKLLGGQTYLSDDRAWQGEQQYRTFYDRTIQASVWIDMADFTRRDHYFTGRYYDKQNQFILKQLLNPSDVFVDIGANFGIHTLLAARRVGSEGQVYAFEPQKRLADLIRAQAVLNDMSNVIVHNLAVGDEQAELSLRNPLLAHTGTATLRAMAEDAIEVGRVQVVRADDVLSDISATARIVIKIDVEGFEFKALKGLQNLLSREKVAVLVEITSGWLTEMGVSVSDIYQMMEAVGFEAYTICKTSPNTFGIKRTIEIPGYQHDGLFIKPEFLRSTLDRPAYANSINL
ncbi:methyltransferase FkbM family protein [Leptolyngbya sp. NIES-3755]|nr:methyltransferase FkbM family protein [Leptolyngbya sp. NIES-3755]